MEILNILIIYFKHTLVVSVTSEKKCDGVFFSSKVAACHVTEKGLRHSFFWMNFVKFFRSVFF